MSCYYYDTKKKFKCRYAAEEKMKIKKMKNKQ